jgi:hypothetical protein
LTTKRTCHVALGLALGLWVSSCRENNPAYLGRGAGQDSGVEGGTANPGKDVATVDDTGEPPADLGVDQGADHPAPGDSVDGPVASDGEADAGVDGKEEDDVVASPDQETDVPFQVEDGGEDVHVPLSDVPDTADGRQADEPKARDLAAESVQALDGAPDGGSDVTDTARADVTWDAPLPVDGPADVGAAADVGIDISPICREQETRDVVSPNNPLVGACHAGKQTCSGGEWVTSIDEVLPADAEACNGIDDNCNGVVDEGCADQCVVVAPNGDENGDGSPEKPFGTIEQAVAAAGSVDGGSRPQVCVAGGASCGEAATFESVAHITMRDGVAVQGNYALTGDKLTYCGPKAPPTTTIKFTTADQGVVFGADIGSHTELSGFVIRRFSVTEGGPTTGASIAGVVVSGGKNVWLSGIFVDDPVEGASTYGVSITGDGRATIIGSSIGGGQGRTSAVGVYVGSGSVELRNNCDQLVAGVCASGCGGDSASLGIWGRYPGTQPEAGSESSAVFAGGTSSSTIVGNLICGGPSNAGEPATARAAVAALRCASGGCALVSGNAIVGGEGGLGVGLALAGSGGPIVANRIEGGCGTRVAAGVLLENASGRLVNNVILGGQCSNTGASSAYFGVHVISGGPGSTAPGEFEVHSNDIEPQGWDGECESAGVFLERSAGGDTAAAGILRNNIVSAGACGQRYAVSESGGASLRVVENNDLYGPSPPETPAILYRRESSDATTEDEVNLLTGASKNISADPGYRSSPTDLRLTSGSRCIDHGTASGAPSTDADGLARPRGDGFDIGAYEF